MALLLTSTVASAAYLSSDYDWYEWNDHRYAITFDYNNWEGAEAEAQAVGGHLVAINDAMELDFVSATFSGYYGEDAPDNGWASLVWIGLYQVQQEFQDYQPGGEWFWSNGDEVSYMPPLSNWQGWPWHLSLGA